MREIELSMTRCRQVTFKVPVLKTDTQALGNAFVCLFSRGTWSWSTLPGQSGQGFALCCEEFRTCRGRPRDRDAAFFAHAKRPVPKQEVSHIDVSETGRVKRTGCKSYWARVRGHGSTSNGCGRQRVVAHPGLLPMGLPFRVGERA